jgi:hypothetical protein
LAVDAGTYGPRVSVAPRRILVAEVAAMTTTVHIKASITPWDDTEFVKAFEQARDEAHLMEEPDGPKAGALVQQRLRESGYPSATVDVVRTVAEKLEHTSHWLVRRDG